MKLNTYTQICIISILQEPNRSIFLSYPIFLFDVSTKLLMRRWQTMPSCQLMEPKMENAFIDLTSNRPFIKPNKPHRAEKISRVFSHTFDGHLWSIEVKLRSFNLCPSSGFWQAIVKLFQEISHTHKRCYFRKKNTTIYHLIHRLLKSFSLIVWEYLWFMVWRIFPIITTSFTFWKVLTDGCLIDGWCWAINVFR